MQVAPPVSDGLNNGQQFPFSYGEPLLVNVQCLRKEGHWATSHTVVLF